MAATTTTRTDTSSHAVWFPPGSAAAISGPVGSPPRIAARLIAWEGGFGERVNEQKMIKEYTAHLKQSIAEAAEGTGWRYQRFKTYKTPGQKRFKLEVVARRLPLMHPLFL
jgi:hypothetical protein